MDCLKLGPAVRTDDGLHNEPSPLGSNLASAIFHLSAVDRVNEVTFAKGLPIHAIFHIQHDLVWKRRPSSSLGRAVEDFDNSFVLRPGRMGNNDDGVGALAQI